VPDDADAGAALVEQDGLKPHAQLVREPDADGFESTPQAHLIARRR
jgi:hypothetical protein